MWSQKVLDFFGVSKHKLVLPLILAPRNAISRGLGCLKAQNFPGLRPRKIDSWVKGTNANLPDDIVVKNFFKVDTNYHARFDATSREYLYVIKNANTPPAIGFKNYLWIKKSLNISRFRPPKGHPLAKSRK